MKNSTEALEHASVRQYCKAVRVPTIAANFVALAEEAVKENHNHIRYLEALLAMESEERDRHAIGNRIRDAQLPRMKTLEEFDFAQAPKIQAARIRELAEGGYIDRSEPVVLIGECGTGKSHLATGLCLAACQQKRRVRFTTAAALVNELVEAKRFRARFDDVRAVRNPVQKRLAQSRIRKNRGPLRKWQVGGDDDRRAFRSLRDYLEQKLRSNIR